MNGEKFIHNDTNKVKWKGFKLSMGFFVVTSEDGKVAMGTCDPLTKEVIKIYVLDYEDEK